jgi:antitoxin YefM
MEPMETVTADQARSRLAELILETAHSHEPIRITGSETNAVLLSEDDWRSMSETIYLLSVPGMREAIREGLTTPSSDCGSEPGW